MKYDGSISVSWISNRGDVGVFGNPLHRFNGHKRRALGLEATPDGMSYPEMAQADIDTTEYLQAAGSGTLLRRSLIGTSRGP